MKNSADMLLKGNKIITASIPVFFYRLEGNSCVFAECPALQIITDGEDLNDAKRRFEEAFGLWIEVVNERYDMVEALKSLGWKITANTAAPKEEVFRVPVSLLSSKFKNIYIPVRS